MLNKRAYMITPIIFIVFLLISVAFSFYVSDIDERFSRSILTSALVDKSISDIYEKQSDQINFVKLTAYNCSLSYCYPNAETIIENCINNNLNAKYDDTGWYADLYNKTGNYYLKFRISSFNATSINMSSNRVQIESILSKDFFKIC
jgi:hypothetical protein